MGPMFDRPAGDVPPPPWTPPAERPYPEDRHARPEGPPPTAVRAPVVVPAAGRIRREALDPAAVSVVQRLQRSGHEAYLVGGCVRDLLLGMEPKDFDVATDATPNRVKRLFRNAWIIGRRFRLVHVRFPDGTVVETATFRQDPGERGQHPDRQDGQIHEDNVFGTAAEDAFRRDFTVNALFYDPTEDVVVDHVGGLVDLEARTIRAIGDPERRLREDPVRMIRAVHFAARLGGDLEPALKAAVVRCAREIAKANGSRLYVELLKVLGRGAARPTFRGLHELGVLAPWMPALAEVLDRPMEWPAEGGGTHEAARAGEPADVPAAHLTWNLLGAADAWGLAARGVPESLMLATLYGPWLLETWERGPRRGHDLIEHIEETFRAVALRMSVPRRACWELRDILWMQDRLRRPPADRRRQQGAVHRPTFPEALAYFELDVRARDGDLAPAEAWRAVADEVWARSQRRGGASQGVISIEADAYPHDADMLAPVRDLESEPRVLESEPRVDDVEEASGGRHRRRRRRGGRGRPDGAADVAPTRTDAFPEAVPAPAEPPRRRRGCAGRGRRSRRC